MSIYEVDEEFIIELKKEKLAQKLKKYVVPEGQLPKHHSEIDLTKLEEEKNIKILINGNKNAQDIVIKDPMYIDLLTDRKDRFDEYYKDCVPEPGYTVKLPHGDFDMLDLDSTPQERPHSNIKPEGLRFDEGKPRTDLLSPIAMMATATALAKGANKYGERNWSKGMKWGKVIGPLLRHLFKFMAGEDYDMDKNCKDCQNKDCKNHTGLPHIDLVAINAMFLQHYFRKNKDLDDREKSGLE